MFVDDLQIAYQDFSISQINKNLQIAVNNISKWVAINGYKFSTTKTVSMTFYWEKEPQLKPAINCNGIVIPHVKTTNFLGLHWDSKLTWAPHIAQLKSKCNRVLNLLRTLSGET